MAIENLWLIRIKYKSDSSVDRYWDSVVASVVFQYAGYDETIDLYDSISTLFAIAPRMVRHIIISTKKLCFYAGRYTEIYTKKSQGFGALKTSLDRNNQSHK